jgi:hypothetical protein
MDILWAAVGISIIVGFVLYVGAGHQAGVLRKQSLLIRHLSDRLHLLEEVENPQFRQRIGASAPPPLEQVLTFSFRFSERFWRGTLRLSQADWDFVRTFGSFVGSVKLERWRSHTVATITEVLSNRKTAAWQTRRLEYYPALAGQNDSLTLWELPLGRPNASQPSLTLELSLRGDALELFTSVREPARPNATGTASESDGAVFFRAPLDPVRLSNFRAEDPSAGSKGNGSGGANVGKSVPWQTFYAWEDESRGLAWHLHLRDLSRKAEWERWKILETPAVPLIRNRV